jgi:hypothetical protein
MLAVASVLLLQAGAVDAQGSGTPAAASRTRQVTVQPGVFYTNDPCALGGQGEMVELVQGTIETRSNGHSAIQVDYHDVLGIGVTSKAQYAIAYHERGLQAKRATLEIVGSDSTLSENISIDIHGTMTAKYTCS